MKNSYLAIGLMSGTSIDGIDLALIESNGQELIKIISFHHQSFEPKFRQELQNLITTQNSSLTNIKEIEQEFTILNAKMVNNFLKEEKISAEEIDFIGFHGQTIFHNAKKGLTWQIGNNFLLSHLTKIKVVGNFRYQDMVFGGKGAPLVPIYHFYLTKKLAKNVAIINLGGVSNISYFENENLSSLWASDICFGNSLFDDAMQQKLNENFDFDGKLTKSGTPNYQLAEQLLNDKIFSSKLPFSFDRNNFSHLLQPLLKFEIGNILATLALIYAKQLKNILQNYQLKPNLILFCGGGSKNQGLIAAIKKEITNFDTKITINLIDDFGFNSQAIEAQAFAFLAIRSFLQLPLTFKNTTAIDTDSCLGANIFKSF
jgi:anhydro-N-acetylmuramic acid kinase